MEASNFNINDLMSMSIQELLTELNQKERLLFDLRFKKATRQPFKPHEIKVVKKQVAQLKSVLTIKVQE
jgi:large subunit ribosomal protein L29